MKVQRKRMASKRPHRYAARHTTPAWKAGRWPFERLVARVIDERRAVEFWAWVKPRR